MISMPYIPTKASFLTNTCISLSYFMPLCQLIPPLPTPSTPRDCSLPHASFSPFTSPLAQDKYPVPYPPCPDSHHTREHESHDCQHDPMAAHPENQPCILPMPTTPLMVTEETPWKAIILIHHEDTDATSACAITDIVTRRHVFFPNDREKEGPGAIHHSDVGKTPVPVVCAKGLDNSEKERMLRGGAHCIVRNAGRCSAADPC